MADPFFEVIRDGEWNACIGKQGDELNYVYGYLEAARILAATVVEKSLTGSRDTLAMPILYNARHGLELALKYVLRGLEALKMVQGREKTNHDILAYWCHLRDQKVGDRASRELIEALEPFVTSLARIDNDGQELRYFQTREGERSLGEFAVVNLPHIRDSVERMGTVLHKLTDHVERLGQEHLTGTRTPACSRTDLREIARILGDRRTWLDPDFVDRKREAMERYGLGSRALSQAINAVERSRELAPLIGIETPLTHLSDEKAVFVATRWLKVNSPRQPGEEPRIVNMARVELEEIERHSLASRGLDHEVLDALSHEEFADLQVVFYIGRDVRFGEEYEALLKQTLEQHLRESNRWTLVHHLMSKTNLLDGLISGLGRIGRPSLADQLFKLRDEATRARAQGGPG